MPPWRVSQRLWRKDACLAKRRQADCEIIFDDTAQKAHARPE